MTSGVLRAASAGLPGSAEPLVTAYDLAVLDLDGVVYVGPDAVPGAADALAGARAAGMALAFVTNNASRPPQLVVEHLVRLGIQAHLDDVVTSAQVAARMLADRLPAGSPVLVVGGEGLRITLVENGLRPVASMDDEPVAVVQGFSPDLTWRLLAEGSRAVRAGLPWIASNLDLTFPTPFGPAPGNGALVGAVAAAAGREPDDVAGKPAPGSFHEAARRTGSARPLVVGDRLDTDLEGAVNAGMDGLVVLTGVSTATDLLFCTRAMRPTHLGRDLDALHAAHPAVDAQVEDGRSTATSGAATVATEGDVLAVVRPGADALDLLRAGCVAAWPVVDAGGTPEISAVLAALAALEPEAGWAR